jgi:hypothetical protein
MPTLPVLNTADYVCRPDADAISVCLATHGVAVIPNFYNREQCIHYATELVRQSDSVRKCIRGKKPGRVQNIVCNTPIVWEIRNNPLLKALVSKCYANLNEEPPKPCIPSVDALTILDEEENSARQGGMPNTPEMEDWAHLDQIYGNKFGCIQGSIAFTDSSASFVVSPKSHLIYDEIMKIWKVDKTKKWLFLGDKILRKNQDETDATKQLLVSKGGIWQGELPVTAGSVILWLSSTIHSAKLNEEYIPQSRVKSTNYQRLAELKSWRVVVYVCYNRVSTYTPEELEKRWQAMKKNRTTNHTGKDIVDDRKEIEESLKTCSNDIRQLIENPANYKHFDKNLIDKIIRDEMEEMDDPNYIDKIEQILSNAK